MSVIQPNLPTARVQDWETPLPLNIAGIMINAYHQAMDRVSKDQMDQARIDQMRQEGQMNELRMRGMEQNLDQGSATFTHQQAMWKQGDADHAYEVSQRPFAEQIRGLQIAAQQTHLASQGIGIADSTLKYNMLSTEAAARQHAMEYVEATAQGKNPMPANGKITSYGYEEPGTRYFDTRSASGVGAFVSKEEEARIKAGEITPNKLRPGDIALSIDTREAALRAGIKPGEMMTLHFADGTSHTGRYMDHTADSIINDDGTKTDIRGRYDIYSPGGKDPRNDKPVVAFSRGAPGLPSADQIDRMLDMASLTKDPTIIARAAQIADLNSLRPEIQQQRNAKAWNAGHQAFFNRLASLPDAAVVGAVSRMAGINLENPASLPPANQPGMWDTIMANQQKAIAEFNKDPATFRRVQIQVQPRTPISLKGDTLTSSSLSHIAASDAVDPETRKWALAELKRMAERRDVQANQNATTAPVVDPAKANGAASFFK